MVKEKRHAPAKPMQHYAQQVATLLDRVGCRGSKAGTTYPTSANLSSTTTKNNNDMFTSVIQPLTGD